MTKLGILSENVVDLRQLALQTGGEWTKLTAQDTPWGPLQQVYRGRVESHSFLYIPYNGICEGLCPTVSSAAAMHFFKSQGVERVISVGFAGGINPLLEIGDVVVCDDILDMTRHRVRSVLEHATPGVRLHYRSASLFCPALRALYLRSARELSERGNVIARGTFCTSDGPRFESPAEIRAFKTLGADFAGLTVAPEVFFARELEMCFANVSIISNIAEGQQRGEGLGWEEMRHFSDRCRRRNLVELMHGVLRSLDGIEACPCREFWHRRPTLVRHEDELL